MSEHIFIGTRKGLFTAGRPDGGEWTIERSAFLGDPVGQILDDPRDGTLYACLELGHFGPKLHRSDDRGETWQEVTAPQYPDDTAEDSSSDNGTDEAKPPSVNKIWSLVAGADDEPGKLWAGTLPGGLFVSADRGETWELVRSLWNMPARKEWFGGGADQPGIHSIVVPPENGRRITIGVSCGGVWRSEDGGETWTNKSKGMWAAYMPPDKKLELNIQDPHCVVCCRGKPDHWWSQHHNGVFRSTDDCETWVEVEAAAPSAFGFPVVVHPTAPDTAWFVPAVKDECRIPVEGKVVVSRTTDGGESFEVLREGLPQTHAYDLVYRHAMDIDASGDRLSFGSTTGSLWASDDGGDSWRTISTHLPPIYSVKFSKA